MSELPTDILLMLIQWGLTTVLGIVAGWCAGLYRRGQQHKKETEDRLDAICNAMADILGDMLDDWYKRHKNGEEFTSDELEKIHGVYRNYKACGGDGLREAHTEKILEMKL